MPIVGGRIELVVQAPSLAAKVREREAHVALALVGRIVDGGHEAFARGTLPGKGQEAVMGPVAVPGWGATEKLPVAVAEGRLPQQCKKSFVEDVQFLTPWFVRASSEMR